MTDTCFVFALIACLNETVHYDLLSRINVSCLCTDCTRSRYTAGRFPMANIEMLPMMVISNL